MINNGRDKYNIVFNICKEKLNKIQGNDFIVSCEIDNIEGILYTSNAIASNLYHNITINGPVKKLFKTIRRKNNLLIVYLVNNHDVKITINNDVPSSIQFNFTSPFLRNAIDNDDTIRFVCYFFQIFGIDYNTDYIKSNLKVYCFECYADILSRPKDMHKIVSDTITLINTDIHGDVAVPKIRINGNHLQKKLNGDKKNGDHTIEQSFIRKSKFKVYNKLFQICKKYNQSAHWWRHYKDYFDFTDDEFQLFNRNISSMPSSYKTKIYNKLKSNGFSIIRVEYCLDYSILTEWISNSENENGIYYKSFITVLNNPEHLFLFLMEHYNIELMDDNLKWNVHPLFFMIEQVLQNNLNTKFTTFPLDQENEKFLKRKLFEKNSLSGITLLENSIYKILESQDDKVKLKEHMDKLYDRLEPLMYVIQMNRQ